MAEITIALSEFRKLAAEHGAQVFESGDAVAMTYGPCLVKAIKRTAARIFRRSIPMLAIGYSGVAKWQMDPIKAKGRK